MNRLFADTFFFFAFLNADDSAHREASTFYDAFEDQLVTTEWVLTELADGLSGISNRQAFVDVHRALRSDPTVIIIPSSNELFAAGVERYATRPDKEWSLTDCISFVVMEREGLTDALTGDRHFEQAGFKVLLSN
ncbi:MAG: PIN domain-containing protein [Candidatus Udaeobacter sp.]